MRIGYSCFKKDSKTNTLISVSGEIDVPLATPFLSIAPILESMGLTGPFTIWIAT